LAINESRYLVLDIVAPEATRTVSNVSPTLPSGRAITFLGTLPAANTDAIYGVTLMRSEDPAVRAAIPSVAAIAVQAYAVGARFTLTAPQAVNAGGQAGIYQVKTAFTPAAVTLTAGEAANVFYVGAELRPDYSYQYGNISRLPLQDRYRPEYAYDRTIALEGRVRMESGAAIAVGAALTVEAATGRVVPRSASTQTLIGYAMEAVVGAGEWLAVELRIGRAI